MAAYEGSFHHVAISVRNLEKAKAFYCGLLGFSIVWEHVDRGGPQNSAVVGLPDVVMDISMLEGYGVRLELFYYKNPQGRDRGEQRQCDFGLNHFALKVKDARAVYAALAEKGVQFNSPPQALRPGVVAFYMRDPEGNTVEILENNVD